MCGIVGYTGKEQAAPILLDGLSRMEYRGYDSAGVAVDDGDRIYVMKTKGRLQNLCERSRNGELLPGTVGIGHTRWATHGAPSDVNAHPHCNRDKTIAVVHNGIIENYLELKTFLEGKGYQFESQTDTEVITHLLDYYTVDDPVETLVKVMQQLKGSYALGILFRSHPGELYAVRKDSPLIVGTCENGNILASDVPAILPYTRSVFFIQNEEIVRMTSESVTFCNEKKEVLKKKEDYISWDVDAAEKGGYEHFMMKEMDEQPKAVRDTLNPRIKDGRIVLDELGMTEEEIAGIRKIFIVACGSAYHAGVTGKYVIEGLARIPVEVDLASEFRYRNPILDADTLVIVISQSGETADSLAALRAVKKYPGVHVIGIVNVIGSTIAREADHVMYTWAGPEIAVATTKAYSTQLTALYLLALWFAGIKKTVTDKQMSGMIYELLALPDQIERLLAEKEQIRRIAGRYIGADHIFFMGRGIDYAISLEGSLKLKEISYIHSEAYAAGELKHGTISLIEEGTLVTALLTQEHLYKKMISNIAEVQTRGAIVFAVTDEGHTELEQTLDEVVYIPKTNPYFANSLAVIPLQIFSYYVAAGKGCDVDKPRNLAKSVTVE